MSATATTTSNQGRARKRLCSIMVPIHCPQWPRLHTAWGRREHKLQIADSHCAAFDNTHTCFIEDGDDLSETDVTMTVKMSNNASPLCRGCAEIDGQHSAARLQNSSNLGSALTA